jgi:uncharacterized protein YdaU (DUF1376 family)
MAQYDCLPFWTDDYLADTTGLKTEEHGAYFLLLMHAWRSSTCDLPNDDEWLARLALCSTRKWRRIGPLIRRFFVVNGDRLVSQKLQLIRTRCEQKSTQNRQNVNARWLKQKESVHTTVIPPHYEPHTVGSGSGSWSVSPSNTESDSGRSPPRRERVQQPPPADALTRAYSLWNAFADSHDLRRVRKLSETRSRKLRARLDEHGIEGWIEALEHIAGSPFLLGQNDRGWQITFDFMLRPTSLLKLLEGNYDNGADRQARAGRETIAREVQQWNMERRQDHAPGFSGQPGGDDDRGGDAPGHVPEP